MLSFLQACFLGGLPDDWRDHVHPDFVWRTNGVPTFEGQGSFPDVNAEVEEWVVDGHKIGFHGVMTGTHDGKAGGYMPTGLALSPLPFEHKKPRAEDTDPRPLRKKGGEEEIFALRYIL